ncbi:MULTISPECIES: DUF2750 domain-containing protein [Photobacterium]|uniref:Phage-shock protein n=1 Tax=Photobacterium ganghwense TaxID=320778 RepID=A0A0J1HFM9_9GAMM|nr:MULTISPECIES: DUF2750 domain-containing protein [Photobacterium]KLV10420.1 phage-shock protein [Photobacterium ganghwense]MBV1841406.1 DUF2750 domain-containing protein [Photobacterium ganghwense]PSU09684.1 DUF2750 domain-containing protein [Photobacterium ganghwense]QSV16930.1 DUF2750 domain-containing protein [Photobacterium ganghwense]
MSTPLDPSQIATIQNYDSEKRYQYLLKEVVANREIWILTDEHGCVMLNTEDDDCVPVWPNREFAEAWATGDWESCKAESISLNKWHSRWTYGLADDQLAVVVFPNVDEDGLVIDPEELDFELRQQEKKQSR